MSYAITLDGENRIMQAADPEYAPLDAVLVDTLPDGNIHDYRYVDGAYVHDPLPAPEVVHTPDPIDDLTAVTVDHEYRLILMEMGVTQ